jgi:hypothetical protein
MVEMRAEYLVGKSQGKRSFARPMHRCEECVNWIELTGIRSSGGLF